MRRDGRWWRTWLAGGATVLALAGGRAAGGEVRVDVSDFKFQPQVLTVAAGTSVVWTNRDEEPHTVTAKGGEFASPGLDRGEAFTRTFDQPGTYEYRCALHPRMTGKVVVK